MFYKMMFLILNISIVCLNAVFVHSVKAQQEPTLTMTWQNTFGMKENNLIGNCIQQTSDGGYIISGTMSSNLHILKINKDGKCRWRKTLEDLYSTKSCIYTIRDGFIVLVISSRVQIIKIDNDGNIKWIRKFGGDNHDRAYSLEKTKDGGYILVGSSDAYGNGDVYVIKIDKDGFRQWQRNYGGTKSDEGYSIQTTEDGGYIVAGWTDSFGNGNKDVYVIKLDRDGKLQWQKTFGGPKDDLAYSMQKTADGGYVIVGSTESFGMGGRDIYIIKIDKNGNLKWQKTFGGSMDDKGYSIKTTDDNGYIIAGWTRSFGYGRNDVYIIKIDKNGNLKWQKTFGGSSDDEAYSIQRTVDGGYIIAGWTESFNGGRKKIYIVKLDYDRENKK